MAYFRLHILAGSTGFLNRLRCCTAFIACLALLGLGTDYFILLPPNSLVDGQLLQLQGHGLIPDIYQLTTLAHSHFGIPAVHFNTLIYVSYMACCLLLFFGVGTAWVAWLLLCIHISLFTALPQYSYGADYFLHILLFYCCIFHVAKKLPADSVLVYQRCFRIHLCLVYFFSGVDKALGATWWNGQAIWKTLQLPYFNTWFGNWLAHLPHGLLALSGIAIVMLELSYPLALFNRRIRPLLVYGALVLHVCTALFMKLYFFALVMMAFNFIAWFTVSSLRFTQQSIYHFNTRPGRKSRPTEQTP